MGRLKLFDGDADDGDVSKIEIDQEFAKRYDHNKKREDLHRYEQLKKNGQFNDSNSDSDDSTSDEDASLKLGKKSDYEYFDALLKIKNKDPVLKNKDAKLFDSDSESESEDENDNYNGKVKRVNDEKKDKKPMYLKDVVSKHLIEAGPEYDDNDEEAGDRNGGDVYKVKTYSEEHEEFRRDVLKAIEEEEKNVDGDGDFLRVKEAENKEEDDISEEVGNKLDEYFGKDEKLDEDTMFLKEYFRNRMWLDNGKSDCKKGEETGYSEDEDEIERQEDYERNFNFRFEENAGERLLGHVRKVEGSFRKKDDSRKLQRDRKDERIAQAELVRVEELKHLKNLKKKEINEKLQKIREVAGIGKGWDSLLDEDYLEEEFDPDEYDRKMKEAFDEGYYKAEDLNPEFGSVDDEDVGQFQKPDFDKEDELLELTKNWDEGEEFGEGFLSARQRAMNNNNNMIEVREENELIDSDDGAKRKRKREPSEMEKAVREQLMEEYYKLDCEDTVGDLKTRFKYKQVKAKRFGLSSAQILTLDERDLNQYVNLKKLAPYVEKEWKVPRIKTLQLKQMNRDFLIGETLGSAEKDKKKKKIQPDGEETTKVVSDTGNASRRSKRRHRQAEFKPSHLRRKAYGQFPSKSKSKK